MKTFFYDRKIQVYMYAFIYDDPNTMSEEDYFPDTKIFFQKCNKISTPVPVPKNWLGFSYISSEYYHLDLNFDEIENKSKPDHSSYEKLNFFCETNVVIQ